MNQPKIEWNGWIQRARKRNCANVLNVGLDFKKPTRIKYALQLHRLMISTDHFHDIF